MTRWPRLLLLLIALLWLPLRTVAAFAMPFCTHTPSQPVHIAHEHGKDHHLAAHPHASVADALAAADLSDHVPLSCDECGSCHLACASFLPAAVVIGLTSAFGEPPAVLPAPTFFSHFPLLPERPPRSA